jgi:hypothetical protein
MFLQAARQKGRSAVKQWQLHRRCVRSGIMVFFQDERTAKLQQAGLHMCILPKTVRFGKNYLITTQQPPPQKRESKITTPAGYY